MKTLFFTAHTSVYSMRVKVAGLPGIIAIRVGFTGRMR
jgi:hypothetical protein